MPHGDGTGPQGLGEMSGRGAGFCAGYNVPGRANPVVGCGFGRGRNGRGGQGFGKTGAGMGRGGRRGLGLGRGIAAGVAAAPEPAQRLAALKAQAEYLQSALTGVSEQIAEFEKAGK